MWRRIHTLYLALAALLIAAMFFMKFATVVAPDGEEDIMYYEMTPTALLMLSALCANGVAVFTYKNRLLQMRLASTAALVASPSRYIWHIISSGLTTNWYSR